MTKNEAVKYIYSFRKMQKSSSHERIESLLSYFSDPHKRLKFIHVVGTNGKGSVSGAISSIFSCSGYKTGLFTSPYVIDFCERIQIDGRYIDDEALCDIVSEMKEYIDTLSEEMKPTVFEFITVLGMIYFCEQNCDMVVLEAGIGGEHDSTNVIPSPEAAVFTSISLDHTEMLGETVKEIATEKSGIIKKGCIAVSYPDGKENGMFTPQNPEAFSVIKEKAERQGCSLYTPSLQSVRINRQDAKGTEFTYGNMTLFTSLWGDHQTGNMLTAAECALRLREKYPLITDEKIREGIASFSIFCRMERISAEPVVILDGGHNEGCMRAIKETVKKYLGDKKITLLMASMKDKDYLKSLEIIMPVCENAVFTRTDEIRGESPEILSAAAERYGKEVYFCDGAQQALAKAVTLAGKNGAVLCCGSFYLASDVRKFLSGD